MYFYWAHHMLTVNIFNYKELAILDASTTHMRVRVYSHSVCNNWKTK